MRAAGIDESAIQFFTDTHLLLSDFHLHGQVDIGYAVAPWVNMGRPQAVFLNGDPAAIPIFSLDRKFYDAWQTAPGAAELKRRYPNLGLWTEYSREGGDEPLPEAGQRLVLEFVLQEARPGPVRAWLPVAFTFNAAGVLTGIDVRAPKPA
jgi:hypothetical protein